MTIWRLGLTQVVDTGLSLLGDGQTDMRMADHGGSTCWLHGIRTLRHWVVLPKKAKTIAKAE